MTSDWNSRVDVTGVSGQKCVTRILCMGNDLLGDDSLGRVVAERIQQAVPADVEVISTPESGLNLLDYAADAYHLIIIDTVKTGTAPPGTIYQLQESDLQAPTGGSAHYVGLLDALVLARFLRLSIPKQIVILAVEIPASLTIGQAMHPAVLACIPALLGIVRDLVTNGGMRGSITKAAEQSVNKRLYELSSTALYQK